MCVTKLEKIQDHIEMSTDKTNAKYLLSVRNSKAIESADIAIDSITVLSGVNASGKSTLARMVHELVNMSAAYPLLLERYAWKTVKVWAMAVSDLDGRLSAGTSAPSFGGQAPVPQFETRLGKGAFRAVLDDLDAYTQDAFAKYQARQGEGDAKRAFLAFVRAVGIGEKLAADARTVYSVFVEKRKKALDEYNEGMSKRNYLVYNYAQDLKYDVRWLTDADAVSFSEDSVLVYSVRRDATAKTLVPMCALKEIFGVRQSFYIASPWVGMPRVDAGVLTIPYDDFPHYRVNHEKLDDSLFEVLGGTVDLDGSTGAKRWTYHRCDGLAVDLADCATGIKSFSILNILYRNGYLNAETLLIIDEPEAHLHPQWIVEYARILVLVAKRLKVRMILTSHSPDMVSALQEISECEGMSGVHFYLAESKDGDLQYVYRNLGGDVEPIFKAFNKAIDYLELYRGGCARSD